jgi:hypothetical protein
MITTLEISLVPWSTLSFLYLLTSSKMLGNLGKCNRILKTMELLTSRPLVAWPLMLAMMLTSQWMKSTFITYDLIHRLRYMFATPSTIFAIILPTCDIEPNVWNFVIYSDATWEHIIFGVLTILNINNVIYLFNVEQWDGYTLQHCFVSYMLIIWQSIWHVATYLCCNIVANGINKCFSCIFVCQMSQFYLIMFIKQHATCTQKWGITSSKGCWWWWKYISTMHMWNL